MCGAISGSALTARRAFRSRASRFPPLGSVGAPLTSATERTGRRRTSPAAPAFGYRWNDWLRFDATWDYRTRPGGSRQATVVCPYGAHRREQPRPASRLAFSTIRPTPATLRRACASIDNAFLANAYFDLGTYYGFTPYVGGGLGLNINTLTASPNYNETANGQPYAANLTAVGRRFRRCGSISRGRPWRRSPTSPLRSNSGTARSARPPGRWPGRSRRGLATRSLPASRSTSAIAT